MVSKNHKSNSLSNNIPQSHPGTDYLKAHPEAFVPGQKDRFTAAPKEHTNLSNNIPQSHHGTDYLKAHPDAFVPGQKDRFTATPKEHTNLSNNIPQSNPGIDKTAGLKKIGGAFAQNQAATFKAAPKAKPRLRVSNKQNDFAAALDAAVNKKPTKGQPKSKVKDQGLDR